VDGSGGRLRLLAICSEAIAALAVIDSMFRSAAFLKRNLKNHDSGGYPITQRLQSVRIRHTANWSNSAAPFPIHFESAAFSKYSTELKCRNP
jgi:hypothetical protein